MGGFEIGVIGLKGLPAAGGGARAGEAVLRRLSGKHRFTVFAMGSHAADPNPLPGVKQVILPTPVFHQANLVLYYWLAAVTAVLKHDFDLVHVHHGMGGYVVPLLRSRFPVIMTFHGYGLGIAMDGRLGWLGIRALRLAERLALRFADEVVTAAPMHVPYFSNLSGKPVHWIPNGVDRPRSGPSETGEEPGNYIAFAAARIIPIKGCHLLLQAAKQASIDERILIVGDTSVDVAYAARLRELARGLNVEFVGLIKNRARLLRLVERARVFVFPSLVEAMSNMLLEAVMSGAPLLCSDIPGNRSLLREDETIFFQSDSVTDLAEKLVWTLDHAAEARRRVAGARTRLGEEYSWDRIAEDYDRLYEGLAVQGRRETSRAGSGSR